MVHVSYCRRTWFHVHVKNAKNGVRLTAVLRARDNAHAGACPGGLPVVVFGRDAPNRVSVTSSYCQLYGPELVINHVVNQNITGSFRFTMDSTRYMWDEEFWNSVQRFRNSVRHTVIERIKDFSRDEMSPTTANQR